MGIFEYRMPDQEYMSPEFVYQRGIRIWMLIKKSLKNVLDKILIEESLTVSTVVDSLHHIEFMIIKVAMFVLSLYHLFKFIIHSIL